MFKSIEESAESSFCLNWFLSKTKRLAYAWAKFRKKKKTIGKNQSINRALSYPSRKGNRTRGNNRGGAIRGYPPSKPATSIMEIRSDNGGNTRMDGVVRSTFLRTSNGKLRRPVQRLYPLELYEVDKSTTPETNSELGEIVSNSNPQRGSVKTWIGSAPKKTRPLALSELISYQPLNACTAVRL